MVIKKAAFVTSLERYGNYPGIGLPEIAVAGKSNVGKSSMINKLCMRNKLAKVSATPGKTRLLNVFASTRIFTSSICQATALRRFPRQSSCAGAT